MNLSLYDWCIAQNRTKLLEEWDYSKNSDTPHDVAYASNKKAYWKCKEGHQWEAMIANRSIRDRGCPYCSHTEDKVIDSRPAEDNSAVRRRRECLKCGSRFTTYEKVEDTQLMVIKKDETREAYDRTKAEKGIMLACHKRPVSAEQVSRLLDDRENQLFNTGEKEIPVSMISEIIMDRLKELDEVAYVRFASVNR